jgi:hypothetical protein
VDYSAPPSATAGKGNSDKRLAVIIAVPLVIAVVVGRCGSNR